MVERRENLCGRGADRDAGEEREERFEQRNVRISEFVGVRFESGLPGVCGWSGKADFARGLGEMVVRLNIATPEPTLGVFA